MQQPLEIILKNFPQAIIYHYMDDIFLADSDKDVLENMLKVTQKVLPCWGLQFTPEKIQRGDSLSYLGYKINQQKNQPQKVQICKDQLQTLNDFQKLMGDINWLRPTSRLST